MEYLSLKEIQEEEKNILKSVINYLKDKDLKYYIYGGTLLGAVRHKGFIPWDDDIDIIMMRPEYEKFIKELKKSNCMINSDTSAIGFELDNSDWPFIKIINKNILVSNEKKCDSNLWMDIFPVDGVPDDKKFFFKIRIMKRIFWYKREEKRKMKLKESFPKRTIKRVIKFLLKPLNYERIIRRYINLCKTCSVDKTEKLNVTVWGSNFKMYIKKNELESVTYDFDGLKVNGLKDYNTILTRMYGDYTKLPPVEKRNGHTFKAWRVK